MYPYLLKAIEQDLVNRGSQVEGCNSRIEKIIKCDLPKNCKLKLLKNEYGTGGGTATIALYDLGWHEHNTKGITYIIRDEEGDQEIHFSWNQVLEIYERFYILKKFTK